MTLMSSNDLAIEVHGLGKSYQIDHSSTRVPTFRDAVIDRLRHPFGRAKPETFWALRDIDLQISAGDVVGIIGRNGAGKSTLLKVLSRITEPTTGRVDLYGRVGSLLEVGTGFHPELTGRENIFLNGAILGMRRAEIRRQFDAIVDFAEVEKFLDTPVKRYSSGMYVRLAFAVAAHLEPEILIVDEVLAVGDSQFQNKCLGKMGDVARSGRTVLLVSHNMAAVTNLCTRTLLLDRGRLQYDGSPADAVQQYMQLGKARTDDAESLARCRPAWAKPLIQSVRTVDEDGNPCSHFLMGSDIGIEMSFETGKYPPLSAPVMGVVVNHSTQGTVGGVNMRMTGFSPGGGPHTSGVLRCWLQDVPLLQGSYSVDVWLGDGPGDLDSVAGLAQFEVEAADVYGTGVSPFRHFGTIFLRAAWDVGQSGPRRAAASGGQNFELQPVEQGPYASVSGKDQGT
jgi:lipopolysaccharide transport system ATP-binding protein